jgi:hypothetical protein
METECFDLHSCLHCGKTNHLLDKCRRNKKVKKQIINYGWISSWRWHLKAKILLKSYCLV